jgi:hypothetical protein
MTLYKAAILTSFVMNENEFCTIEIKARKLLAKTICLHFTFCKALFLYFQQDHTVIVN